MANVKTNVSVVKPKVGGAIWVAVAGDSTTLPTSVDADLDEDFKCLGYISEDGVTITPAGAGDYIKDWGGDNLLPNGESLDQIKFKLLEVLNIDVLKFVFGASNVTGSSLATGVSVAHSDAPRDNYSIVIDTVLTGTYARFVIPNGSINTLGDIVLKKNEAMGYDLTLDAVRNESGVGYVDYYKTIPATPATEG